MYMLRAFFGVHVLLVRARFKYCVESVREMFRREAKVKALPRVPTHSRALQISIANCVTWGVGCLISMANRVIIQKTMLSENKAELLAIRMTYQQKIKKCSANYHAFYAWFHKTAPLS